MRNLIRLALLAAILPSALAANPADDAREILAMWEPKSVTFSKGTLTIILPQRAITPDLNPGVLAAGICLMGSGLSKDFSAVRERVVLNEFARQGHVNEHGAADCDRINAAPAGSATRNWSRPCRSAQALAGRDMARKRSTGSAGWRNIPAPEPMAARHGAKDRPAMSITTSAAPPCCSGWPRRPVCRMICWNGAPRPWCSTSPQTAAPNARPCAG